MSTPFVYSCERCKLSIRANNDTERLKAIAAHHEYCLPLCTLCKSPVDGSTYFPVDNVWFVWVHETCLTQHLKLPFEKREICLQMS